MTPTRLGWLASAAFISALVLGPAIGEYGALHYLQLGLGGLALLLAARRPGLGAPLSRRAWSAFLAASFAWLLAGSGSNLLSFNLNAIDFSIFDWMVENTRRGQVGLVPLYGVNHFGVHSSFFMFAFVPLYALASSPLWLVAAGPLIIWSGLFPLRRLVRRAAGDHGGLHLFAALAWVASCPMGRLSSQSFRIEHAPLLALLWFFVGWVERRRVLWVLALVGLLCAKEDTALMLASFGLAHAVFDRARRREGVLVAVAALGFLIAYSKLQHHLIPGGAGYGGFWIDFGDTPARAALGMLTHPGQLLSRLASSGLLAFFGPMLFLPFFSWRAASALAPTVVLYGAASFAPMHALQNYYAAALLAPALFGILEVARRGVVARAAALVALIVFPVVGYGYAHVFGWSGEALRAVAEARALVADAPRVCAQGAVMPHLGYPRELRLLVDADCGGPDTWVVVAPRLNPTPLEPAALEQAIAGWRATRRAHELGDFVVFEPR